MTRPFTVLQVDRAPDLEPYTFERKALQGAGGTLVTADCRTPGDLLQAARASGAEVLWLAWAPALDGDLLLALPEVRLVVRWGIGYDQIDTRAATTLGIAVANAPTYGTVDVAEHTVALVLNLCRGVGWFDAGIRAGRWPAATERTTHRFSATRVGIVGLGRIGRGVAERLGALGFAVTGYDLLPGIDAPLARRATLAELLSDSDIVSIHVPLDATTRHLIDAKAIAGMRPGSFLVNTSRGGVVDTDALVAGINDGHLAGAALDVHESEPIPAGHPLLDSVRVLLTPHVAGYSLESWQDLRREMCTTVIDFMADGWSSNVVNPDVKASLRRPPPGLGFGP